MTKLFIDYPAGQVEAPDDLMALFDAAPKIKTGGAVGFPSKRTREGRAYYKKAAEIEASGGEIGIPML
jgi:hypothetical protein